MVAERQQQHISMAMAVIDRARNHNNTALEYALARDGGGRGARMTGRVCTSLS